MVGGKCKLFLSRCSRSTSGQLHGRMSRHERQRLSEQRLARLHSVPRRSPGRMGQRHDINSLSITSRPKRPPHRFRQRSFAKQLSDSKFANGQHQTGLQEDEFAFQPLRTVGDFCFIRHPVAPLGFLPRKTAANRGKVDAITRLILRPSEGRLKPLEQRLAGRPGERAAKLRLFVTRRLANEDDAAGHRMPDHDGTVHARAKRAPAERIEMAPHRQPGFEFRVEIHRREHGRASVTRTACRAAAGRAWSDDPILSRGRGIAGPAGAALSRIPLAESGRRNTWQRSSR